MNSLFVFLSVALVLVAVPPYILDTIRGKTKPERMTWFLLTTLGAIAFYGQVKVGATWSLFFSGLDLLGSMTVLALSLRYGVGGTERRDIIALIIAVVGLIISLTVHEPIIAIVGVILADLAAIFVTLLKVWRDPSSETTISWLLFGTAGVFGLLTIRPWIFTIALYPLYLVLANYAVPIVQLLRVRRKSTLD